MENIAINKARELLINSGFSKFKDKGEIEKALDRIYVCSSKQELYELYLKKTGIEYDGDLKGFNNSGISYLAPISTEHEIIHETLHTLSSKYDEHGKKVKNGIEVENTRFGSQVNEGITEYLSYKLSGKDTGIYALEKSFFAQIDESFSKFFDDEDALIKMYCENNTNMFKDFLQTCLSKDKNCFEDLYANFSFMNKQKIDELTARINKGAKKVIKSREFDKKHPILSKLKSRILGKNKDKNKNKDNNLLNSTSIEAESSLEYLKEEVYKPGENENIEYNNINKDRKITKEIDDNLVK